MMSSMLRPSAYPHPNPPPLAGEGVNGAAARTENPPPLAGEGGARAERRGKVGAEGGMP